MSNDQTTSNQVTTNGSITYIDQMISLRIFKTIEKSSGKLDVKTVIFLIGLIGADSVKSSLKKTIETGLEKVMDIQMYRNLYTKTVNSLYKPEEFVPQNEPGNSMLIQYEPKSIFWTNLQYYKGFTSLTKNYSIKQVNKSEYELAELVYDIKIKCEQFECVVLNELLFKFSCNGHNKKLLNTEKQEIKFDKTKTLLEQIPFPDFVEAYKYWFTRNNCQFNTEMRCLGILFLGGL